MRKLWVATVAASLIGFLLIPSQTAVAIPDLEDDLPHFIAVPHGLQTLVLSPDGRRLYGGNNFANPGTLSVVDTVTGRLIRQREFAYEKDQIEISADGRHIFAAHRRPNEGGCFVAELDAATLKKTRDFVGADICQDMEISPNGRTLYISGIDAISFLDLTSGRIRSEVSLSRGADALAISPDGKTLYATDDPGNRIHVIDTATGTVLRTIYIPRSGHSWTLKLIALRDNSALLWLTDDSLFRIPLPDTSRTTRVSFSTPPCSATLSADGKRVYVSEVEQLRFFDVASMRQTVTSQHWGRCSPDFVESRDGKQLYMAAFDSLITLGSKSSLVYPVASLRATVKKQFKSTKPMLRWAENPPFYTVTPTLPKGLHLNRTTGIISGKAASAQKRKKYSVYSSYMSENREVRTTTSITISVAKQKTQTSLKLSRSWQRVKTRSPARVDLAVTPRIAGVFQVYEGDRRVASVKTQNGAAKWLMRRDLSTGSHTLRARFIPQRDRVYASSWSDDKRFTVVK